MKKNIARALQTGLASALLLGGVLVFVAAPAGCSNNNKCVAGTQCVCDGDTCDFDCPDGSCNIKCQGGATCDITCAGGGCSVNCDSAATCNVDCPGNSCNLQCGSIAGACKITSCALNCPLNCGTSPDCSDSCTIQAGCPKS